MPRRNLQTSLRRRPSGNPMQAFDRLPAELRGWLCAARLPWSPRSAAKLWARALQHNDGDTIQALAVLDRAEAKALARDARKLWGVDHPAVANQFEVARKR